MNIDTVTRYRCCTCNGTGIYDDQTCADCDGSGVDNHGA
jgi:DnaJ-class molecular chaperone